MRQWLVTLRVQVQAGVDEPPIVIKVEMSDECYLQHDADQREQLIETSAQETLIAGKAKIWKTPTAPLFIEVTDRFEIQPPQLETNPPDHRTFSALFAWVKTPRSPR